MKMATNSNIGFHHGVFPASMFNRHAVPFQSGVTNSSTGMIAVENSGGFGIFPVGNSGGIISSAGMMLSGRSGSGLLLDTVPGLKHGTGLAVDWSFKEQTTLEEGLVKYADESSILRYIKIAARLPDKTVRDVALRCRWMTKKENGKRRKAEDHFTGKKMKERKISPSKERKEKLMDSSAKANTHLAPRQNVAACSFMMQHKDDNNHHSCEALSSTTTRRLLDENAQVFNQIAANLATFKIRDNVDLFCRTRNNITAILNDMKDMPGIMSQMPPLPVSINEELANTVLPGTAQVLIYGTPVCTPLKQEPRC